MKKIVSWIVVFVMLLSAAACGGGSSSSDSGSSSGGSAATDGGSVADNTPAAPADPAPAADSGPVTYTVYFGNSLGKHTSQFSDTEVGKKITELTGVRLSTEYIVGANEEERAGLLVATGDYPDIIIPHNVAKVFIDAGAIIDLNDLYNEYAPNIQKLMGNSIDRIKDQTSGNFELWGLSSSEYNLPPQDYPFSGFFMKHAAVAANEYKTIRTADEYFNAIRSYVAANPTTNGQPTVGFSGPAEEWRFVFTTHAARKMFGWHNTGPIVYDPADNYAGHAANIMPFSKEYFLFLNELNREGLLDPEFLSQSHDEYVAKVASGRVVGFYDEFWEVQDAFALIKQDNRIDDAYIPFSVLDANAVKGMNDPYSGIQALAVQLSSCISVNAKDPVGIMKYFDALATEEIQALIYWGIEGVHYQKDENGRRYLTGEQYDERSLDVDFGNRTGVGHDVAGIGTNALDKSAEYSDGSGVWNPMNDREVRAQYIYNDMEKEILSRMGWTTFMDGQGDMWRSPYGYGWDIDVPTDDDRLNDVNRAIGDVGAGSEYGQLYFQYMMMADTAAEAEAYFDELVAKMEAAGVADMEAFRTGVVRQRVAEWGE